MAAPPPTLRLLKDSSPEAVQQPECLSRLPRERGLWQLNRQDQRMEHISPGLLHLCCFCFLQVRTADMGGYATSDDFTHAVIAALAD